MHVNTYNTLHTVSVKLSAMFFGLFIIGCTLQLSQHKFVNAVRLCIGIAVQSLQSQQISLWQVQKLNKLK